MSERTGACWTRVWRL